MFCPLNPNFYPHIPVSDLSSWKLEEGQCKSPEVRKIDSYTALKKPRFCWNLANDETGSRSETQELLIEQTLPKGAGGHPMPYVEYVAKGVFA